MDELIPIIKDSFPWLAGGLFGLSLVFEFSKIKINPWKWLFSQFAKLITKDVNEEIDIKISGVNTEMSNINKRLDDIVYIKSTHYQEITDGLKLMAEKLEEMAKDNDDKEMMRLRWEILSFARSLKNGDRYSQDEFYHIFEANDKYHRIIEKRNFVNGVIDADMRYVNEVYQKCLESNSFA